MYGLKAKVVIEGDRKWVLDYITACEIVRDSESLTDTCKITLPKRTNWVGADKTIPLKRGDKVKVWLSYSRAEESSASSEAPTFVGYIRDVGFKTPMVLTCEDELFQLKQMPAVPKSYRSVTIEQLLKDQGITQEIRVFGQQDLGQYRIKSETVASVLGALKEQGVRSFFRYENDKPVLYAGVLFEQYQSSENLQVFATGLNIISDSELKQVRAETMRIKVKAISIQPNNKKIRVELGDKDGEMRKLHTYNKNKKELKAWAEQEIKRLKRDGLTGSFVTFGAKLVDKLDTIGIKLDGKRKGKYQVKKNVIKFGVNGFRQTITLGSDCTPLDETAPILDCNLQANQIGDNGLVLFPKVGSFVVVGLKDGFDTGVVLLTDELESLEAKFNEQTLKMTEEGIILNGGAFGGLIKIEELTKKINTLEDDLNKLKQVFSAWAPVSNDGGGALKGAISSWAGQQIVKTQKSDYENEKVKH